MRWHVLALPREVRKDTSAYQYVLSAKFLSPVVGVMLFYWGNGERDTLSSCGYHLRWQSKSVLEPGLKANLSLWSKSSTETNLWRESVPGDWAYKWPPRSTELQCGHSQAGTAHEAPLCSKMYTQSRTDIVFLGWVQHQVAIFGNSLLLSHETDLSVHGFRHAV